ncbi:MAG: glycosyltransferase family protein [Bacteroidota bacterium]
MKHIVLSVLDWGLGHATRSMPLIDHLLANGHKVTLASSGVAGVLLQQKYPQLPYLALPDNNIRYSKRFSQNLSILLQTPLFIQNIRKEQKLLNRYVKASKVDGIISDHRYGCWSKEVPSVFVAHQLSLLLPNHLSWARKGLFNLHLNWLKNFEEIWIPDFEGEQSLSGTLSQAFPLPPKCHFIGPLSRFSSQQNLDTNDLDTPFRILGILSGPEPQRSMFMKILLEKLSRVEGDHLLLMGRPDLADEQWHQHVRIVPHLGEVELMKHISQASLVISRTGYSSLMDYSILGCRSVLGIPTPGQSEQEYLGLNLGSREMIHCISQNELINSDLGYFLREPRGFKSRQNGRVFEEKLNGWIRKLSSIKTND